MFKAQKTTEVRLQLQHPWRGPNATNLPFSRQQIRQIPLLIVQSGALRLHDRAALYRVSGTATQHSPATIEDDLDEVEF